MTEKSLKEVRFKRVGDIMRKDVMFIDGKESVSKAISLMREKRVSSLVIKRRAHDDAWGIITRKDILNKVVDPGKDPNSVKVKVICL